MISNIPVRFALASVVAIAVADAFASAAFASPTSNMQWSAPSELDEFSAYLTFNKADPVSQWYAAYQFRAGGAGSYIGMQPKPNGKVQAVFSNFNDNTDSDSEKCKSGADGGAGISCAKLLDLALGHKYELRVTRGQGQNTWDGHAINTVTKNDVVIGSWQASNSKGVNSSDSVWTERYRDGNKCTLQDIPLLDVTYGAPTGNDGKVKGKLTEPTEGSPCKGKQGWSSKREGDGYRITVGRSGS